MTQLAIYQTLIAHLEAMTFSPPLPLVKSREDAFKPTISQTYLVALWLPAPTDSPFLGGNFVYSGIQQVTVVATRNQGEEEAIGTADQIIEHFKYGTRIDGEGVRIKISRQPYQATPASDGAWLRVPVSIPYSTVK